MAVILELSEGARARLAAEAARRGITIDQLVDQLVEQLPAERPTGGAGGGGEVARRKLGFVGIGASTSGRAARDVDEMLAEGFGRD